MRPWVAGVVLVILPAVASATSEPPELDLVRAYLGAFDAPLVRGEHCLRHGGPWLLNETSRLPSAPPATETNGLLGEHTRWHAQWNGLDGQAFLDDAFPYGTQFALYHRAKVAHYDEWRAQHGHAPVAAWDPATPIPPAFANDAAPGCLARDDEDPEVPFPAWATLEGGGARDPLWGYGALCEFPDLNRLGKSIDHPGGLFTAPSYHASGHGGVGGDMHLPQVSMRDPVFWAWHKWLDEQVFAAWERACAGADAQGPGAPVTVAGAQPEAAAPVPTVPVVRRDAPAPVLGGLVALAAVAAARRR